MTWRARRHGSMSASASPATKPNRRTSRLRVLFVGLTVAGLGAAMAPATAAPGDGPDAQDRGKAAAQPASNAGSSNGRASTLEEETTLAAVARAVPGSDSPGLFTTSSGQAVVRVFGDRSEQAAKAKVRGLGATTTKSQFTDGTLKALSKQLENASRRGDVSYEFHYDAESDTMAVTGNLGSSELPAAAVSSGKVTFTSTAGIDLQSRYYDTTPFWGGAAIYRPDGGRCSTAFAVKNSAGTRYMVTAGHCGDVGTTWRTANGTYVGQTVSRASYPTWDLELIGGSSYGSYVYMGDSTGYGSKVLGAGDPVVGTYYCMSGTTTNENCGKKVTSTNATLCTSNGCTPGLASYAGGSLTQPGDSGGPLVLKASNGVYARGVHKGINGSTMYGERWNSVASYFGVSIVL